MIKKYGKGFTLIELLVVIAIIGILSSVVLASLSSARGKARDNAVIQEARQLASIMALEYSDSGSYAQLQRGWLLAGTTPTPCVPTSTALAGNYKDQVTAICNRINDLTSSIPSTNNRLYIGVMSTSVVPSTSSVHAYTIIVALPSTNGVNFYCIGNSGRNSIGPIGSPNTWTNPGCFSDSANTP